MKKPTLKPDNHKFGLFCYDTKNLGDEIQSIAAERFLPRIDYYINRDNINELIENSSNQKIKLIANGWYLEPSIHNKKINWPPTSTNLSPLFISMHINPNKAYEIFKKPASIEYLKKHSPIGARDIKTQKFLESVGVPSYFSGCMTLTLLPDPNIHKSNFILAVNVSDKIFNSIKRRTNRPIVRIDTLHEGIFTTSERFALARYYLTLYQSAHCIITTRLHTMLPSLALGTPVFAITIDDQDRFEGLINLVNAYSESSFIKSPDIDLDNPPKNPSTFTHVRDNLIKKCKEFTGYDSELSYLKGLKPEELYKDPSFITVITKSIIQGFNNQEILESNRHEIEGLSGVIKELKTQIQEQQQTICFQQEEINSLKNPGIKASCQTLLQSIQRKIKSN